MPSIDKWRSETNRGEERAITVLNRYGLKTFSLPRFTEDKRLFGYPGLSGTCRGIVDFINKNMHQFVHYVEPFAGSAKVYQELSKQHYFYSTLNDKSPFIAEWLKREFDDYTVEVTCEDFVDCTRKRINDITTLYVFDAPWNKSFYNQGYSCFDRKLKEYDEQILELCRKIKGKFIICSKKGNKRMLDSEFTSALITGDYPIFGKLPQTLITTNIEVKRI